MTHNGGVVSSLCHLSRGARRSSPISCSAIITVIVPLTCLRQRVSIVQERSSRTKSLNRRRLLHIKTKRAHYCGLKSASGERRETGRAVIKLAMLVIVCAGRDL